MTKEQFLSAMGDIDDKFLKEIAHTSDEIFEWDPDSEKPQIIRLERRPVPLWRTAAVTAAAVCVLAAGIFGVFGISRLHGIHSAGSSPEVSLNSADSVDLSNGSDTLDDKLNSALNEIDKLSKINSVLTNGHEFNGVLSDYESPFVETELVTKTDDQNFAAVQISSIKALGNYKFHIMLHRKVDRDWYTDGHYDLEQVGGIEVDEIPKNEESTYIIYYSDDISPGDEIILTIDTGHGYSEEITIKGRWIP